MSFSRRGSRFSGGVSRMSSACSTSCACLASLSVGLLLSRGIHLTFVSQCSRCNFAIARTREFELEPATSSCTIVAASRQSDWI
ncbi:hypothetical protein V6N13_014953 [Hibiscus sabdariffa]|uniref:Secreted protein n=1 Tax=Hibiscus sabdariffa TaxID=183260 RepID=A0ABR2RXJ9_9ROSI